jgi:hypothetical protein
VVYPFPVNINGGEIIIIIINFMQLTHSIRNRVRSIGGIAILGLVILLAQFTFADVTSSLLPSSEGNYLQWTPKSGSTHYTMVDESSCNGTTDYNSTATVGNRDSYGVSLSSVPNGATITSISITPCASRNSSGGGSATMNVFYRYNGSDSADAGAYALPTGTTPANLSATNFNSLSIEKASTDTLEIGAVYSSGTKGVRLGRIAVVVTYTPLAAPTNLSATTSGSDIDLSWTDASSDEDGFKIERHNTSTTTFSEIGSVGSGVTTYNDPGLSADTYSYRVRMFKGSNFSNYSNTASSTTP